MHNKVTLVTPANECPREIIARLEKALHKRGQSRPEIMNEVYLRTGELLNIISLLEADS